MRGLKTAGITEQAYTLPLDAKLRARVSLATSLAQVRASLMVSNVKQARIAQIDATAAVAPSLVDTFQRQHNYLRISLTERCNLRCMYAVSYFAPQTLSADVDACACARPGFYCMPSEGVELSPHGSVLTDDELVRLAGLFVRNGVQKIRLTGGEPTVRKGLVDIIGEQGRSAGSSRRGP